MGFLGIYVFKFDFLKDIFLLHLMDEIIGRPIQVNRKFLKFIEEDIKPEYNRVLSMLLQQLKDELDKKYLNKGASDNT